MLTGSLVAIVTPMLADGGLDYPRLKSLIDWHVQEGTDGIVIVGTTGESPTVDVAEHESLIHAAVDYAGGRVPVIAGTGGNSTKEAISLTQFAAKAGADYALSVVPYYNKPTQEGLYRHFKAIAESSGIPVILYNVPARTVADLQNDTVVRLAQVKNVVGIKESTSNIERVTELMKRVPKDFLVLSGNDDAAIAYVQERKQFGKSISDFQGVQFQLAQMATEIEAVKMLVYNAARMKDAGMDFVKEAAMTKLFASQVAERVASLAVEIYGGNGFTKEYPVEKYYRDAKIGKIYEGTSNMQLATIAKLVLGK